MTLIQAQQKYISRVNSCHPGHSNRVTRSARKELGDYLRSIGYQPAAVRAVIVDANDMATLERNSED